MNNPILFFKNRWDNLRLELKIFIILVGIELIFAIFIVTIGLGMMTDRFEEVLNNNLQQTTQLVEQEFSNKIESIELLTDVVRSDDTIQKMLTELIDPVYSSQAHYQSEIYNALQKCYSVYHQPYIKYIAIINPRFTSYTYGYLKNKPSSDRLDYILKCADEADGSTCFITDKAQTEGIYVARKIKKIKNMSFDSLAYILLCIEPDKLFGSLASGTNLNDNIKWLLFAGNDLLYNSDGLDPDNISMVESSIKDHALIKINDISYFGVAGNTDANGWKYYQLINYEDIIKSRNTSFHRFTYLVIAGLFISLFITHLIIRHITRHFDSLVDRMNRFSNNMDDLPKTSYNYYNRKDEVGILHQQFEAMANTVMRLVQDNYKKELLAKDAQLKSLESQMNPHFLYNTLDSINWRAKACGENEIASMTESLGHFLRTTLSSKDQNFTLSQESKVIDCYMTIQQYRFDNRLNFTKDIPEEYSKAVIPKLSIQPLLENAVHYALEQMTDECEIILTCVRNEGNLIISVKNSGSEFEDNLLDKLKTHEIKEKGLGIALTNIEERIHLMFGEEYGLHFYNEEDYATVKMVIPYMPR